MITETANWNTGGVALLNNLKCRHTNKYMTVVNVLCMIEDLSCPLWMINAALKLHPKFRKKNKDKWCGLYMGFYGNWIA